MVRYDWKYTGKEQFPPEPEVTKDFWKQENPGWDKWKVLDWYTEVFEVYACKLKGEESPVPSQLYYIGNREWMTDSGWVLTDGHVEAWDSYTDENVNEESEDPYIEGTIKVDGRNYHTSLTANSMGLLCGAAYLALMFKEREKGVETKEVIGNIRKIITYLEEDGECTE